MRLIDADALLKEYEGAFAYKMLKEIIENAPTVNEPEIVVVQNGNNNTHIEYVDTLNI